MDELIKLGRAVDSAKQRLERAGMQNAANLPLSKRVVLDVEYRKAQLDWLDAEERYREAVDKAARA